MKSTFFLILFSIMFFSCQKEKPINGTRDLKNLSLPQLKEFLNGSWRYQFAHLSTFHGNDTIYYPDSHLFFYSEDSIRLSNHNSIVFKEKIIYQWGQISYNDSAYILSFYGFHWVADRIKNDTLVLVDYFDSEGPNSYYLTKEK